MHVEVKEGPARSADKVLLSVSSAGHLTSAVKLLMQAWSMMRLAGGGETYQSCKVTSISGRPATPHASRRPRYQ